MTASPTPGVLAFREARGIVEQHASAVHPLELETVDLLESVGRVLGEEVLADRDLPPFRRATRDGYAVRAADVADVPVRLEVAGEIKAGADPAVLACTLKPGEAVEIMTGAPVPPGADAVIMVEYTERQAGYVRIQRSAAPGENLVPQGAEARRGAVVLPRGRRMDAAAIAVCASVGQAKLRVHRLPRVAVLSTGDELVDISAQPGPNQIRNSNSYSLAAQVRAAGGMPVVLPIASDEPGALSRLIQQGLHCDLLLITGAVSMGKYDLVEEVLRQAGAEFFFTGTLIQPGKPLVFGRVASQGRPSRGAEEHRATYFFGLPGNPVSTMVTFELFARAMLDGLSGATPRPLIFLQARLKTEIRRERGLTRFLPGLLSGAYEGGEVELVRWQGSGDVVATAAANCYVVIPPDRERLAAGEMVSLLLR